MGVTNDQVRIERATERDVPVILEMIRALAEYERMSDQVVATEEGLRASLFGPKPDAEVLLAYVAERDASTRRQGSERQGSAEREASAERSRFDRPAGFALFFHNYSTFLGRRGLYLEDLFVRPEHRGRGVGKRLLVELARLSVERGCGRFEWAVLDWNEPAIGFYKSLGAVPQEEWTVFRVTGDALTRLARTA